jgi:hypothetical protein
VHHSLATFVEGLGGRGYFEGAKDKSEVLKRVHDIMVKRSGFDPKTGEIRKHAVGPKPLGDRKVVKGNINATSTSQTGNDVPTQVSATRPPVQDQSVARPTIVPTSTSSTDNLIQSLRQQYTAKRPPPVTNNANTGTVIRSLRQYTPNRPPIVNRNDANTGTVIQSLRQYTGTGTQQPRVAKRPAPKGRELKQPQNKSPRRGDKT